MYVMYIGLTPMPVFPQSISIKTGNLNKTLTLINEGEINIPKPQGLREFTFDLMLPNTQYPFAYYRNGFKRAEYFLNKFEEIKKSGAPDVFLIVRKISTQTMTRPLHSTDLWVTLEEYTVRDDHREGTDCIVSMRLKEYKDYGVKTYKVTTSSTQKKTTVQQSNKRNASSSPEPKNSNKTYTVQAGDCLWSIAKKFYDDGSKYTLIRDANKNLIAKHGSDPNMIWAGDVLVIPPVS